MIKKVLLLLVALFAIAGNVSMFGNSECRVENNCSLKSKGRAYYYVVLGSFSSQSEAISDVENAAPDWYNANSVYVAKANGRTVYRVVYTVRRSRSEAEEVCRTIRDGWPGYQPWIWTSPTPAKRVYNGLAYQH